MEIIYKSKPFFLKEEYNDVLHDMSQHKISKIFVNSDYKEIVTVNPTNDDSIYTQYHLTEVNPILVNKLVDTGVETNIPVYFTEFTRPLILNVQHLLSDIIGATGYIIPLFFLFSFLRAMSFFQDSGPPPFSKSRMNINTKENGKGVFNPFGFVEEDDEDDMIKPNVSLSSWVGSEEVMEECKEIISYLDKKEQYKEIGAEMPKGILLEGPPGTGKTLLAKAIATETNSTFIAMSGSEFVELFVGMGASRVRELFDSAREKRPSIIFIDEIDAIGRQRGAGINMGNDEREQTLNQLLYEMDGFNNNDDIVVMAATNRKDVLDAALLRPGRFDRILRVPLPDKDSRKKILDFYLESKKTDRPFDTKSIAELADGFSGAELKNLVNEAAIISVRNNYTAIQEPFIFEAFEKSIVGLIKKNANIEPETAMRVAIHEAGHSLLVLKFKEYFEFQKASVQPTYNGAGGYTMFTEKSEIKEGGLYTKDILKKRLAIAMGGKAAESIYYGDDFVSLGAIEDLKQANRLAKRMIGNFGMGEELEVFFNEGSDESNVFLGRTMAMGGDTNSEYTKYILDKESLDLVKQAYKLAKDVLFDDIDDLIDFSNRLLKETVIFAKDL
jgi:cell division protease FtsH